LPATVKIILASDHSSTYDSCTPPLCLCLHDPSHVHTLQSVAREGTACGITDIFFNELQLPVGFMEASSGDANMAHMVYCLQTSSMADKECWSKCFVHHQLKSVKNWSYWDEALDARLGSCCKVDCIRIPIPQSALIEIYHGSSSTSLFLVLPVLFFACTTSMSFKSISSLNSGRVLLHMCVVRMLFMQLIYLCGFTVVDCSSVVSSWCLMYATFMSPNHVRWLGLGEDVIAHMSRLSMMLSHVGNSHCFISFCVNVLWLIPMWSGVRTLVVLSHTTIGLAK